MVSDYYERLGIEPTASTSEIEAALQKKQPAWSMGTRNPKTRHTNQLYLDEIPALKRALLSDPNTRVAYDAELAAAHVAEREEKLDELQRKVRLRAAKGGLGPADRALLRQETAKLGLGEEALEKLIKLIPGLVEVPTEDSPAAEVADVPADVLDPSTRRQIRVALEHLGRRDLYDALDLFRDAPMRAIVARADEERQRWMKKAQVTAEKTAWLEVISHAQSHLTSPRARVRYDRSLILEAEERFDAVIAFALQGQGRLDAGTRAALIEEAAALGINSGRADVLLDRNCRKQDLAREQGIAPMPAPSPAGSTPAGTSLNGAYKLLRCRVCTGVSEISPVARRSGPGRCRHCGASLKWDCPICKRSSWVDEPRCDCGFKLTLREAVVHHFAAAQHAFRTHDLQTAREQLEMVQKYAPHHVGARNGLARIRQQETEIERARMAYELAREAARLVEALRALEAWAKLVDPASPDLMTAWREVSGGLSKAESLATRARSLERSDPPAARSLYRASLEIAADLPSARIGLGRCPPDSPTNLAAEVMGDRIRITWTPPAPDGQGPLSFAVLRKRGELPRHPADGTRIAEVSSCEFEDRHVSPGDTVSYAVLGRRGGVESIAAVAAGPVVFLADVHDAQLVFHNGEIDISWVPPEGAFAIRVVRKPGRTPSGPRDGTPVEATMDHAIDRVLGDLAYYYGIYAIYKMPDGRKFPSPGVIISGWSLAPAAPPEPPRLMLALGGQVRLDWIEPVRGSIRILRTERPFPHPPGTRLTPAEADRLEGRWIERTGPDRTEDFEPPTSGLCHYTPLLAWGRTVTVGHSAALSRVADPTELRATRIGSISSEPRVQLRWCWPQEASKCRIVARQGASPAGPGGPAAVVETVGREDYERLGCWTISLPRSPNDEPSDFELQPTPGSSSLPAQADPWHIRAYALAEVDGNPLFSPGLEPTALTVVPGPYPEAAVTYTFKRPWLPGRPWSVVFRTEPRDMVVPPLVLVSNARAVPLSADDGEVCAHLPASRDGASFPIPSKVKPNHVSLRAFPDPTAEPGVFPPILLRHPESGTTRL